MERNPNRLLFLQFLFAVLGMQLFGGKLVTACDRTGNLDEIIPNPDFGAVEGAAKYTIAPVKDASGERIKLLLGDGKKPKPLKCEWSTIKDGKLVIGSTGKERTDDDGNVNSGGDSDDSEEELDDRPLTREELTVKTLMTISRRSDRSRTRRSWPRPPSLRPRGRA